jgi:hypothetical protein
MGPGSGRASEASWARAQACGVATDYGYREGCIHGRLQSSAKLRAMFLTKADDGSMVLSTKAMAIYEVSAQGFLKSLLVLKHVPPGRPFREPELLSVTWRNMA